MAKLVYWSTSDTTDVWHLYPDCNALKRASHVQSGQPEAAINAGKSHVCKLCRTRWDKDHPLSDSVSQDPEPQNDSAEGGTPDCSSGEDLLPAPVSTPPPETPPASDVPHAAAPSKPKSHIRTAVVLLAALFFLFIFLYPLYESEIEAAYNRGYDAGYTVGEADGEETGSEEGYRTGYDEGHTQGYGEGYEDGKEEGESYGYGSGYDDGYDEGYTVGYQEARKSVSSSSSSYSTPQESTVTVYITATGEKYHRLGCQYLSKSCYSISLSNARSQGYTPCSRCNPPT